MDIAIYTEGGGDRGYGQLIRCSALAQALEEYSARIQFIVDDKFEPQLELEVLYEPWITSSTISTADITIIDSWIADKDCYKQLVENSFGVYFDDSHRINYPPGLLIAAGQQTNTYGREALIGLAHTILRSPFWQQEARDILPSVKDVFISFGTADPHNLCEQVTTMVASSHPDLQMHVVTNKKLEPDKKTTVYSNLSAKEMRKLLYQCDIGFISCGQTLTEAANCGLPCIGIANNTTETLYAKEFNESGYLLYAGTHENYKQQLATHLDTVFDKQERKARSIIGQQIVDGKGAHRVAKAIIQEANK